MPHLPGLVSFSYFIASSLIMRSVCPERNWGDTSHWSLGTLPIRQEADPATGLLCLVHRAGVGGVGGGISDQACQDKGPGRGTSSHILLTGAQRHRNSPTDHRATLC